jgi:hypothetical protein
MVAFDEGGSFLVISSVVASLSFAHCHPCPGLWTSVVFPGIPSEIRLATWLADMDDR